MNQVKVKSRLIEVYVNSADTAATEFVT